MKKLISKVSIVGATLAAAVLAGGVVAGSPNQSQTTLVAKGQRVTTLSVVNVSCATCAPIVKAAVSRLPGVAEVSVKEHAGASASVRIVHDPSKITPAALAGAITEAGYPATVVSN